MFLRFYLFIHESHREAETQAEGEASSLQGVDVGLNPVTPGSHPELKADTQLLSHPGVPKGTVFTMVDYCPAGPQGGAGEVVSAEGNRHMWLQARYQEWHRRGEHEL